MTNSQQKIYNRLKDLFDKFIPEGEKAEALMDLDELIEDLEYSAKDIDILNYRITTLSETFKVLIDNI